MLGRNIGTGTNIWLPIGLTWPNLAKISPNLAPWWSYSNRGLYINSRGSMEYFMWAIPGSDLGQILPHIWTPPLTNMPYLSSTLEWLVDFKSLSWIMLKDKCSLLTRHEMPVFCNLTKMNCLTFQYILTPWRCTYLFAAFIILSFCSMNMEMRNHRVPLRNWCQIKWKGEERCKQRMGWVQYIVTTSMD